MSDVAGPSGPPATYVEGFAELAATRLWYWDTGGDGEAIVLLHAGTGSYEMWPYQRDVFAAAGYRVIGYSRRGHFGSAPIDGPGATDAEDLIELLAILGVDRFHLVGTAAGGFIGVEFARDHPERLITLSIINSQGGLADPEFRKLLEGAYPPGMQDMPEDFRELGPSYRLGDREGAARWLELVDKTVPPWTPGGAPVLFSDLEAIRIPTLLATGDADLYAPPSILRILASHMPDAETAIITESGHSGFWENPEQFNSLVLNFVGKYPDAQR